MIANKPNRSRMATYPNDDEMFFNAETKPVYQTATFTNRFLDTMKPFNVMRLPEIKMLIYEAIHYNNKEIYDCFQCLIENIFDTEKPNNWTLIAQYDQQHHDEFNQLYCFLSAEGDLFNLIKYLMSDSSLKYLFPVSKLSAPTKMLIEQGSTPNYYLNKLCTDTMTIYPTKIQLNPFEFFFFHFAFYIKDLTTVLEFGNNDQVRLLYLNLLENYLIKFLPTNHNKCPNEQNTSNAQNSIWQSLSSTTSNLLHLGQHNPNKSLAGQESALIQKPSLLNIKPLQNYSFKQAEESIYNQKSFDSVGSIVYKCETLINILTEMWLNIRIPSTLNKKKPNSASLIKNDCPNVIYMMGVRVFIKRVHFLANSVTDKSMEMGNMPAFENHELDEIKKSVWTSKYQIPKRFYNFLKLSLEHWPCDSSFRVPLETWLSYIQPWRYLNEQSGGILVDGGRGLNNSGGLNSSGGLASLQNLNKWKGFVQENILFYTNIYKEILVRFVNLDLLSLKNANMLNRITKVYCQLNLSDLIREAESNCETVVSNSWLASASLRGSLLSPNLRNNSQSICNKDLSFTSLLEDNEKTGFVYVSFFSEEIKKSVIRLMGKIRATIEKIDKLETSSLERTAANTNQITELFSSFFSTTSPFDLEEKQNLEEMAKIRTFLETVRSKLAQLYEIDLNLVVNAEAYEPPFEASNLLMNNSGDRVDATNCDEQTTKERIDQTFSRFTLSNRIEYNGNPDLQPVRTYEFYYLVIFFIYLSELLNGYYQETFKRLYESDGVVGWLAKLLLAGPHEYTLLEKNGIQPQKRIRKRLEPRVNLRFLASKAFYAYLAIFYVFLKLFLFSKTLSLVVLFTLILGALLVKLFFYLDLSV